MWRPDCQAGAVVNAGFDAVRGMKAVAGAVSDGVHMATSLGGFLPLILVGLLIWFLLKLFSTGKSAGVAVVNGYTGGALTRATSVKETVAKRAHEKGRSIRVAREGGRGPQVQAHTGQTAIIKRANDASGKPKTVTVCAGDPGSAQSLLQQRMGGARWSLSGSKPCPHQKASGKDFTFTRRK